MTNEQLAKQALQDIIKWTIVELFVGDNTKEQMKEIISSTYAPHINDLLTTIREMRDVIKEYFDDGETCWMPKEIHSAIALANKHLEPTDVEINKWAKRIADDVCDATD